MSGVYASIGTEIDGPLLQATECLVEREFVGAAIGSSELFGVVEDRVTAIAYGQKNYFTVHSNTVVVGCIPLLAYK